VVYVPELPATAFVKICGVTTVDDAKNVTEAGASALGLNFAESTRHVSLAQAREILDVTRGEILRCAVFRDNDDDFILGTLRETDVEMVQVYGVLSDDLLARFRALNLTVIKALNIDDHEFAEFDESSVDAVLIDGPRPGSGKTYSWDPLATRAFRVPMILAGGLTPENVGEAISATGAWGVDCASGVERSPGHKDHELVNSFVANARKSYGQEE
jgi:phosphoribosylanthranilate isomerase